MSSTGDKIREAREAKGWAQTDLAREAKVSQQTIAKIESGQTSNSRYLSQIAAALSLDLPDLGIFGSGAKMLAEGEKRAEDGTLRPVLLVYTTSPSMRGQIIRGNIPIEAISRPSVIGRGRGFGLYLVETEMQPVFDPGDVAIIHEDLPPLPGTYCIFLTQPDDAGTIRAVLRKLVAMEDDGWRVQQFNPPKEVVLAGDEWVRVQRVVGRFLPK